MSAQGGIGAGFQAALLLARGRIDGVVRIAAADIDDERLAARRSFWAVALCLPAFVCLHVLEWRTTGVPPDAAGRFGMALIGYAIDWVAFAILSHQFATLIERERQWFRYIVLWNWCNVVQYLMLTAAALPGLLGMPGWVEQAAWLIAMGWALWLEWFATRLTLGVSPAVAAALTVFDLMFGLFVFGLTDTVS